RRPGGSTLCPSPTLFRSRRIEEAAVEPRTRQAMAAGEHPGSLAAGVAHVPFHLHVRGLVDQRPDVDALLQAVSHPQAADRLHQPDRKSTRLNSSHVKISY